MNKGMIILMVMLMLGLAGSVSADSLISRWEFTEGSGATAADSADGNNATLVNTEGDEWGTTDRCDVDIPAFEFDGVDDYLYVPYNANLDSGDGGEFTIAFWMKAPDPQQGEIIRIGTSDTQGGTYSGKYWSVSIDNDGAGYSRLLFTVDDGTTERTLTSFSNIDFTQWHYYVLRRYTVSFTLLNMSVDGTLYGIAGAWAPPNPPTGDLVETGEDLYIGCKGPDESYGSKFKGQLADIRYYDYITDGDTRDAAILEARPTVPSCPNPEDGAPNASLNTDLTWLAPGDANEFWTYEVYFDSDSDLSGALVDTVGGAEPNVPNSTLGGTLTPGNYWWRVDAIDPSGPTTITGDLWTFYADVLPAEPNVPADESIDQPLNVTLDWDSDVESGLVDHSELTITNLTTLAEATVDVTLDGIGRGEWQCDHASTLGVMDYDTEFTWQIVDVDDATPTPNVLATGPVWSFTTYALTCEGTLAGIDLDGDCEITMDDLAIMASGWAECGWKLNGGAITYSDRDPCN